MTIPEFADRVIMPCTHGETRSRSHPTWRSSQKRLCNNCETLMYTKNIGGKMFECTREHSYPAGIAHPVNLPKVRSTSTPQISPFNKL